MTFACEVSGRGDDVVLLHGWGMNAALWEDLAARLSADFRVHCVDLPGHGASAMCGQYTLDAIACELAQQMPPHCAVGGWSLGGQIALRWARNHHAQVRRVALIATTPSFVQRNGWEHAVQPQVLDDFARSLMVDCAATLQRFLALQASGDARAAGVARCLRERVYSRGKPDIRALAEGLDILSAADLRAELKEVRQPVLVLHGDRDRLVPSGAAEYLRDALPDAQLKCMPGAGHAPFLSDVRAAGSALTDFFHGR